MKKIKLSEIYMTPLKFVEIEKFLNELLEELAKKGVIELEEENKEELGSLD